MTSPICGSAQIAASESAALPGRVPMTFVNWSIHVKRG